ncbi:MAG: DUF362 domain-containing protein [Candidatus Thorarchaeota archaeon]
MKPQVALIDIKKHKGNSLAEALNLLGGIPKLNKPKRDVILKVGVYAPDSSHHTTVEVTGQIIKAFDKVRKIYLTESDSYKGTGDERLLIWKKLFSETVIPYNLSEDTDTRPVKINTEVMDLTLDMPKKLFKPRVFVTTHVLRTMRKGSVLKNLFGLVPIVKKAIFHKNAIFNTMLPDITEAIGGIDLAVLDGTYLHVGPTSPIRAKANVLVVGTDAVAVETIGYMLLGMKPHKLETIQAFAKRGLGVAEFDDIEILGASFDAMKEQVADAYSEAERIIAEQPRRFSPPLTINNLIKIGYFKLPHKRTFDEVMKQMEKDDPRAAEKRSQILANLQRRVRTNTLQGEKGPDGWTFWAT